LHTIYRPCVCIVAQGAKRTIAGASILDYAPGQYLTVSVDMPVLGQITNASGETPYLCLKVEIDPAMLSDLALGSPLREPGDEEPELGLQVSPVSAEIIDAAVRLVSLLDRPQEAGVLAPLYERELAFLLLTGPQGARLRQMAMRESRTAQVAKAIRWISENFRAAFSVEDAAAKANMSASTFYQHFKSVTALSPLQFQKQLRLQEARRLLVSEGADAASASFAVGYSSPQQFNREYARLFGAPPQRDASRLRASNGGAIAASA
jgi:AraC-like DNA-binding protein